MATKFSEGEKELGREKGFIPLPPSQAIRIMLNLMGKPPGHYLIGLDPAKREISRLVREKATPLQEILVEPAEGAAFNSGPIPQYTQIDRFGTPVVPIAHRKTKPKFQGHDAGGAGSSLSREELENRILAIWSKVLDTDNISLDDAFFDLGGHSLLMVQVRSQLKSELGIEVSGVDLFRYPTIRSLAEFLD